MIKCLKQEYTEQQIIKFIRDDLKPCYLHRQVWHQEGNPAMKKKRHKNFLCSESDQTSSIDWTDIKPLTGL